MSVSKLVVHTRAPAAPSAAIAAWLGPGSSVSICRHISRRTALRVDDRPSSIAANSNSGENKSIVRPLATFPSSKGAKKQSRSR